MKELLPYLAPFKRRMLLGLTIKITGTVAELCLPNGKTHNLQSGSFVFEI